MRIGDRIKQMRKEKGISAQELGKRLGKDRSTIYRYEKGEIENLPLDILKPIAYALDTTPQYLMGWEDEVGKGKGTASDLLIYDNIFTVEKKRFPLLGEIACGEPIFALEDRESFVVANSDIDADFCLVAKGDSMQGARILDGDIVFIKAQSMVNNGEIAAVIIEDEATLKRVYYYPEKKKLILNAENPRYEPLVYSNEELDNIRILGKAVAFQSLII